MKVTCTYYIVILYAAISIQLHAVKTVYIPRSQGHAPSMICMPAYELTAITTLNYAQSYKNHLIAEDLFGRDYLTISGSQAPNRNKHDLLADNFGLAPDFKSIITFSPKIENVLLQFYFNKPLDQILSGLYVNIMLPVNYTRWGLNPCEKVINRGSPYFQNGYMGDTIVTFTHAAPLTSSDINQGACNTITSASSPADPAATAANARAYFSGNVITGDILRPLAYNKISWCPLSRTDLAEIIVRLGRNLISNERTYLSAFARASFQTGNKPRPEYLFTPIVGNGHFFELGLGTQGQYRCTHLDCPTNVTLLWDGSFETLFQTKQLRTFDFCTQGPLSRYLLLKRLDTAALTYAHELIEASYVTTFPVLVSRGIQGDLDLKLYIEHKGFTQTFGYALWGTSKEKICPQFDQPTCPTGGNIYGIKGTSGAYNYVTYITTATVLEGLNATENSSSIRVPGPIDNPEPLPGTTTYANVSDGMVINPAIVAIASNSPLIVGCGSLDIESAQSPAQLTHAFIAEMGYTWEGRHTQPAVLVGASIETATSNPAELHQWSVWLKGSVAW
ncbi:MAG: hypothetical protein K2X90_01555 [Candidatus Babeliaceae bacterium]|nr:hypothetical protein [Candidatus Babeliaceae bacterium]